jgi:hypothetical protein
MYYILCDGEYYGCFVDEQSAEFWLENGGWSKKGTGWFFPGHLGLFAIVERREFTKDITLLENRMQRK